MSFLHDFGTDKIRKEDTTITRRRISNENIIYFENLFVKKFRKIIEILNERDF